jgi:hypothetical protein
MYAEIIAEPEVGTRHWRRTSSTGTCTPLDRRRAGPGRTADRVGWVLCLAMNAGEWIALAAAVFAAAAVVFAGLSWHQSRRSADASVRSASASERSADSAERAAQAAEPSALAEERAATIAEREEQDRQAPSLSYAAK